MAHEINYERMLEKLALIGLEAEKQGLFDGKRGKVMKDGKLVYEDPAYQIFKESLKELTLVRIGETQKTK